MHYFKRNIGDYHKKAGKLSMLEHGAYTLLIDACYDREIFPTKEMAIDWCWARTDEEVLAVEFVLSKFFKLVDGVYSQDRINEEIESYHNKANINKDIAIERERKRKQKRERDVHEPCTNEHEPPPNQEPRTTNQEPLTNTLVIPSEVTSVPVQEIVELFNKSFPELPQVQKLSDARRKIVKQRWVQNPELQTIESWGRFFDHVRRSDFLMGRTAKPWSGMCFDWMFNSSNFTKIYEGNYHGGAQ